MSKAKLTKIAYSSLFAALMALLSPVAFPIGAVAVTLGIFAVMLAGVVLDIKSSLAAVTLYILLGICGLPVFSGAMSGIGVLAGPTGGYLWSYPLTVMTVGLFCKNKSSLKLWRAFYACGLSLIPCYFFGTLWYVFTTRAVFMSAIAACVLPFLPFDLIKAFAAAFLGTKLLYMTKFKR